MSAALPVACRRPAKAPTPLATIWSCMRPAPGCQRSIPMLCQSLQAALGCSVLRGCPPHCCDPPMWAHLVPGEVCTAQGGGNDIRNARGRQQRDPSHRGPRQQNLHEELLSTLVTAEGTGDHGASVETARRPPHGCSRHAQASCPAPPASPAALTSHDAWRRFAFLQTKLKRTERGAGSGEGGPPSTPETRGWPKRPGVLPG
jgi:hypothetical protein